MSTKVRGTNASSQGELSSRDTTSALSVAWHVSVGADMANATSASQTIKDNNRFKTRKATPTDVTSDVVHAGGVAVGKGSGQTGNEGRKGAEKEEGNSIHA